MQKPFRFGVVSGGASSRTAWVALAKKIEQFGYSTLLLPDRLMMSVAPFTALAIAAEATTTLRLGSYVFCNDYRHPAMLAKEIATLDMLSSGRVEPGLGAGVGPSDFEQMGLPFESAGVRVSRLEESLHIIKQFFSDEPVNFSGKYYTITNMRGVPKAIQKPHPPLLVAGGQKRMLTIAAQQADIIAVAFPITAQGANPSDASPEQKIAWIREAAGERFSQLELAQTHFGLTLTDSPAEVPQFVGGPPFPKTPMSIQQAIEFLLEQRERLGISYIQINQAQIENFLPVVAQLNGK